MGNTETKAQKVRDGLPLVVRTSGFLDEGSAPLAISRVSASSSSHSLRLSADLCEVRWPEGTPPDARILPDRWLTVDFTGPGEELAKLPDNPRAAYNTETVRCEILV